MLPYIIFMNQNKEQNIVNNATIILSNDKDNKINPQFDFYKDFEIKDLLLKENPNVSKNNTDETTMMLDSFPIINENLRTNILLSIEIYKKIIDFDINYVHNMLKEQKLL